MALSGSFYTNISSHWRLQVEWSGTQSIDGNYTDITANFYWIGLDSYSAVYASHVDSGSITIEGAVTNFSNTAGLSAGQKKLLGSATTRVYHNADGTKATSIQAYYYLNVTLNGTFYGGQTLNSGTIYLDTIPRASGLTSTCTWIAGVQNLPISISRATTDFHHSVEVRVKTPDAFGGAWVYVGARDNIQTSTTFDFTLGENTLTYQTIHQYEWIDSWVRVITYNSAGTMIGYKDYYGRVYGAGIAKISFSNPNIGSNISATLSNMHTEQGFAYTGIFKIAGTTIKTFTFDPATPNVTLTFTDAEKTQMYNLTPNSNSVAGQVEVTSKYNGVDVNDKLPAPEFDPIFNFTAYVTNSDPVFNTGSISYKDTNTTIATMTGNDQKILQSKSSLTAYVNTACTTKNGATFTKYVVTISGKSGEITTTTGNVNIGAIDAGTDQTLSVKAYDSRGNFSELTLTVTMIPYTNPAMNLSLERNNKFDTTTILKVNGTFSNVVIGTTPKNSIKTLVYHYKQTGATSFGSDITLPYTSSGTTFTATNTPIQLDNTKGFELEVSVTDTFGTVTQTITVGAGVPLVFIDTKKNSVGINQFPTHNNSLEIAGDLYLSGSLVGDLHVVGAGSFSSGLNITGDEFIHGNLEIVGGTQGVKFDAGRTNKSTIYWNASGSADYGIVVNVDGSDSAWFYKDGTFQAKKAMLTGGESHFANGTYTDPRSGVGQAVKVSGGLATDSLFIGNSRLQIGRDPNSGTAFYADAGEGRYVFACDNGQYFIMDDALGASILSSGYIRTVWHQSDANFRVERYDGGSANLIVATVNGSSDRAIKKNIETFDTSALDAIKATQIYKYHFQDQEDTEKKHVGIMVQEAPTDVADLENMTVELNSMIAMCWKAIQELYTLIDQKAQFLDDKKQDKPTTPAV